MFPKKANVRSYDNKQQLLFPPLIGDLLPEDHLAHVVDDAVEAIDLGIFYEKIPEVGNMSYDPALMIKVWFYGYATGVCSSRRIEAALYTDVAFMYLAGMQKPDFKILSEFRRENIKELKGIFIGILKIYHELGITKLGRISIDSKVMKGNASADNTYTEEELEKELERIEKEIDKYIEEVEWREAEEDIRYGAEKRGDELADGIKKKEERIKKMKELKEKLKRKKEELKKREIKEINITDGDVRLQKGKGWVIGGYRGQIAVDENQIIIACDVTEEQNDKRQLIPMIEAVMENIEKVKGDGGKSEREREWVEEEIKDKKWEKIKVLSDAGYYSIKNLVKLEESKFKEKIDAYIAYKREGEMLGCRWEGEEMDRLKEEGFKYKEEEDVVICSSGGKLYRGGGSMSRSGVRYYVYRNCKACKNCNKRGDCIGKSRYKRVWISEHRLLVKEMKEKLSTKEGKEIYSKRKSTAEPVHGNLAHNLGFRGFLLRGKEKVRGEYFFMCIAHNILKISKFIKDVGKTLKEMLIFKRSLPTFNTS